MIDACGLGTHTFRVACEDARGLRAGALIAALGGLCAERRPIVASTHAASPLTDEEVDRLLTFLAEQTDAEAIVYLLTLHKSAENHAEEIGAQKLREILGLDAVAIFDVLGRFAPGAMNDALAVWYEHVGADGSDDA
jgi:hypothetical protein